MFKLLKFCAILFSGLFLTVPFCFGQTNVSSDLETILKNTEKQAVEYQKGFKDLIAKETKTFVNYKANGELKTNKTVESNFLVFESKRDERVVSEFRNVTSVNGKMIGKKSNTSAEVFDEAQRTGSIEKELEKIQKRSAKFDDTLEINGFTLFQAPILSASLRPYFEFAILSKEQIGENDEFVVSYMQTKETPLISSSTKNLNLNDLTMVYDLPKALKKYQIRLSGKLWIDSKTFQLRREERNLTVQTEKPFRLMTTEFEYTPSSYGFLVPKSILFIQFRFDPKNLTDGRKETSVRFDYSEFTKTKVEVEILDDEEPAESKPQ